MLMWQRRQKALHNYVFADFISAALGWTAFYLFHHVRIEKDFSSYADTFAHNDFLVGLLTVPFGWVMLYYLVGTYTDLYRKSRFNELFSTFFVCLAGVLILFFIFILNQSAEKYYFSFVALFLLHFSFTLAGRIIVLENVKKNLENGFVGYNTLIIGGNKNAVDLYNEIVSSTKSLGYIFKGFIDTNGDSRNELEAFLPNLGKLDALEKILDDYNIEEVIIAVETSEHHRLNHIINKLADKNIVIKIIPDIYDILSGSVKMNHVWGAILIEIYPDLMPEWQKILKRLFDIIVSALILVLLLPLYLFIALRVKLSSPGPVFYVQERIGQYGQPFKMYKFRSMYVSAEENGPKLSSKEDQRITPWGRIMRKWRFDELPQFWNVLKNDMSIVGPRPERQYFINKIIGEAPHYKHLHRARPGITSWGMVKFGYAENVQEMIHRMKYDLLYIENMSIGLDIRILFYTFIVILQGRGK